ncbi:MAG: cyclic nucleotide-binding domain-containing protein [Acidimicrobiales bacterium]
MITSRGARHDRPVAELMTGLSRRRRRRLLGQMSATEVSSGQVLTEQGARGREFFVLTGGHVEVRVDGEPVAEVEPGDFFGEISLLSGLPRTATVVAGEDATLEVMNRREFATVLDMWPAFALEVEKQATLRMIACSH